MGTWGEGLYDNDGALDELGDLFAQLPLHAGAVPLATTIGLATWLHAPTSEEMVEAVQQHMDWVVTLPKRAQKLLQYLVQDPESFSGPRTRSAELTEVLGSHCAGPRYDALLTLTGSQDLINELGRGAAERLEDGLRSASDFHEAASALGCLGVVLELAAHGYWSPPREALKEWRLNVKRLDKKTSDERDLWDDYVSRVHKGLRLLKAFHASKRRRRPVSTSAG
jgi:hypothetical protein